MSNNQGFSIVEGLLVLVVITVIGGAGYSVFNRQHPSSSVTNTSITPSSSQKAGTQDSAPTGTQVTLNTVSPPSTPTSKTQTSTTAPQATATSKTPAASQTPVEPTVNQIPATVGTPEGVETITNQDANTELNIVNVSPDPVAEDTNNIDNATISVEGVIDESSL